MNIRGQLNMVIGLAVSSFVFTVLLFSVNGFAYDAEKDIYLNSKKGRLLSLASSLQVLIYDIEKTAVQLKDKKDQKTAQKLTIMLKTIENYKKGYKSLTGMAYAGHDVFLSYWEQNEPYLYWSETKKMLMVDEQAKKEKRVLHVYSKSIPVNAGLYWRHFARGTITEFLDFDGINIHIYIEGLGRAKANKSTLENRKIKQREFRNAAGYLIGKMKGSSDRAQQIELLKNITDQDFGDYELWLAWWEKNKNNLVLNREGTRLVARGVR